MNREARLNELIASATGPAPWYWHTFPTLESEGGVFRWRFLGTESGHLVVLEEESVGRPLLALNTYVRAFAANPGHLGLWYPTEQGGHLEIVVFELAALRPIEQLDALAPRFRESQSRLLHASPLAEAMRIPQGLPKVQYPGPVSRPCDSLPELFLLASGPSATQDDPSAPAISIYVWHPASGLIDVLPQEWFTAEKFDLGYQWITRMTRDPQSGHLVGGGIRIDDFELDESGTRLLRQL